MQRLLYLLIIYYMRLDKFLANNNIGTRSEVKKIVKNGRIKVNDTIVKDSSLNIDENNDSIYMDGKLIKYEEFYYIMLNKPAGYVCSAHEKGESSVLKLIDEDFRNKLYPVGRLDKDTTGLLLLTNDGPLTHELLAPKKHVDKEYFVVLRERLKQRDKDRFENGLDIGDDKPTKPATLIQKSDNSCHVIIHEGRFHQIKRMFEALDNEVIELKRLRMKNLILDNTLEEGQYRRLTELELENLKN